MTIKTKKEVTEFNRRKDLIEKVLWNRDRVIFPSQQDKEEFEALCSICCDMCDAQEWSRFEKLALKYIKQMEEPI